MPALRGLEVLEVSEEFRETLGPFRAGIFYGAIAVVVALAANLHFLLLDAAGASGWVIAVVEGFRTQVALAAFLLLGILAAVRTRPSRLDEGVPYKALLLRDCAMAATLVAVIASVALIILVFLQATVLSGPLQSYAADAAPRVVAYIQELGERFSDPADPVSAVEIQRDLAPPALGSLGQSISNLVLRTLLLGGAGALVGLIRGRRATRSENSKSSGAGGPKRASDLEEDGPYPYEEDEDSASRDGGTDGKNGTSEDSGR